MFSFESGTVANSFFENKTKFEATELFQLLHRISTNFEWVVYHGERFFTTKIFVFAKPNFPFFKFTF